MYISNSLSLRLKWGFRFVCGRRDRLFCAGEGFAAELFAIVAMLLSETLGDPVRPREPLRTLLLCGPGPRWPAGPSPARAPPHAPGDAGDVLEAGPRGLRRPTQKNATSKHNTRGVWTQPCKDHSLRARACASLANSRVYKLVDFLFRLIVD